ncbi:hypothetical protein NP493_700g01002 [Ridgeia piscesae]|uniref:EGF-like domain-containing protein n=1 Tax=Ridgeia piscesae TaxID=27915 RepID=A0AAD9KQW9_RIDPI|nr:hypothetical protein NP493_700g01002 [Ridgeia piscesae]
METEEGYVSYSSQMNDTGSELFKTVEENVARMTNTSGPCKALLDMFQTNTSGPYKHQWSIQTPVVRVKLYFLQEASVDVKKLESYFQKRDSRQHTDKLVDVSGLTFEDVCGDNPCENGGTCGRQKHTYQCKCPEVWMGRHCTVKNEAAIRYRSSTVALGAAFGVITVILLVALLAAVVRNAADRKRIRRTQISFRRKQSKEDQLNDAGASVQVDETSGQHQSPGGKNDKSNDAVSPRPVL